MAAPDEPPGAAFLRKRLSRAQAVPPAERSPEVQAFIESVQLGRQICDLLPLRPGGGEPALPLHDGATVRRCAMPGLWFDGLGFDLCMKHCV